MNLPQVQRDRAYAVMRPALMRSDGTLAMSCRFGYDMYWLWFCSFLHSKFEIVIF